MMIKKLVMSNDKPEIMTEQQRYCERNREKYLEKEAIMKLIKKGYQKWRVIDTKGYLKKKKRIHKKKILE